MRRGEIVFREVGEALEVMREGDEEATYVCHPVYRVSQRSEPSQSFDPIGEREYASFDDAVALCLEAAAESAEWWGTAEEWDGQLSFEEEREGEWRAREYDTLGSDWIIARAGYVVHDQGFVEEHLDDEDDLRAFVERKADLGWI